MINKLKLKNFKLYKNLELSFDKINIIKGINFDNSDLSSNASGKSSIIESLIFALYGEASGKNLIDLINFNNKSSEVCLESDNIRIIRSIPTELRVFMCDKELQKNTLTLKQQEINNLIGDYDFFKKYRLINKQAINLLDLGIVSLRKELMAFIDTSFSLIRQNLLSQKLERENKNINKRLYTFYLSKNKLEKLEKGLDIVIQSKNILYNEIIEIEKTIQNQKSNISSKEKMIYYKQNEIKSAKEGICPILKEKCIKISKSLSESDNQINSKMFKEIEQLSYEIKQEKINLEPNVDYLNNLKYKEKFLTDKISKTKEYIIKLKEAFKFAEYKYTLKDIELYTSSIKILDDFSGWYIQKWLDNLAIIINDLLSKINLAVSFSANKQFLTVSDTKQIMKYEQLSSGQQIFLNTVFKLAILLNNGFTDGIIMIDEGINNCDLINLKNLITILKSLPFQVFLIYQNYDLQEDGINMIAIERKDNISYVKN